MRNTFLALMLALGSTAQAQIEVARVEPGMPRDGVVYYLPKTTFRLTLLLEKTTYTPGDFARYAEKYLNLSDVGQTPAVSHSIIGHELSQAAVADTSKCYTIRLKGKSVGSNVVLSPEGILLAVNTEARTEPQRTAFTPAPKSQPTDAHQYLTTDAMTAGNTAKRAELTAQQIGELLELRQQLVAGEADEQPTDEHHLQMMLDQIDREREALLSLFTGTCVRDTTEHTLTFTPDREMQREVLFRLSDQLGLVDADDLSGEPCYLSVEDLHQVPPPEATPKKKKKKEDGLYVNVPGKVRLTLVMKEATLATAEYPCAQFGVTELLSGALFKRFTTHLTLNPYTGAVDVLHADMPEK